MKIYQIESENHLWVVIADTKVEAKEIVRDRYLDDAVDDEEDDVELEVTEEKEVKKGTVLSYDNEDIYWQN